MPYDLEKRLVIGLASSALFNLEESDSVFRSEGEDAYRKYQRENQNKPLPHGVAFSFIRRLLSLNKLSPKDPPVEVILLSRNDPDTGLRVIDLPPDFSTMSNLVESVFRAGDGSEKAFYRRADSRLPQAGGG
ncbi:5'-nucleotidase, partial [Pseudomonas aeruginosa]